MVLNDLLYLFNRTLTIIYGNRDCFCGILSMNFNLVYWSTKIKDLHPELNNFVCRCVNRVIEFKLAFQATQQLNILEHHEIIASRRNCRTVFTHGKTKFKI